MKKAPFFVLQLLSMFLFLVLLIGIFSVFKEVFQNDKSSTYNIGYGLAGLLLLGLFFWLNSKLYRYASRKLAEDKKAG